MEPYSYGHNSVFFLFSWAAQPLWGMFLIPASSLQLQLLNWGLRVPSAGCWFSLLHLISNSSDLQLTDFLSSPGLYNCSTSTFFLWASQIALIQPVHVQGYILIFLDRLHLLFTPVHLLFWLFGQGQYVTEGVSIVWLAYDFMICVSLLVSKDRSQKLINLFVSETIDSVCICFYICIIVIIDITKSIQHMFDLVRGDLLCLLQKAKKKEDIDWFWTWVVYSMIHGTLDD